MLEAWREQRSHGRALAQLRALLQTRSVGEVAATMTVQDVRRLARHIAKAVGSGKASPEVLVMALGVLATAAGWLGQPGEAQSCVAGVLAAHVAPGIRAAAAWAAGYLQLRGDALLRLLQAAQGAGGEVGRAAQEALERLGANR